MAKKVFISFDYEHDDDLRTLLVGQSRHPGSPFEIADYSLKERLGGDWKAQVKEKIKGVSIVVVLCGEHTDSATGVSAELAIAQELSKEYFLLKGRSDKICRWPKGAKSTDKMYNWTWDNLKALIGGSR